MKRSLTRSLVVAGFLAALPSFGGVFVNITLAPPVLPVYAQPVAPGPDYMWTPGYWSYGPEGYFWVPGAWVLAPRVGLLWTPGYWGFAGGFYAWHAGYWGPHVGFYGGVNYGFGYSGVGFGGGVWTGGHFRYNTAVANVNTAVIHNTYVNRSVIVNNNVRTSFNGPGGINREPTGEETRYGRESHVEATGAQASHEEAAGRDRNNFASVNRGRPSNAAMAHPVTASANRAEGSSAHPAANNHPNASHPNTASARKPASEPHNEEKRR